MPIYEFECEKCGHQFERMQKISDPPPKVCPKCHGKVRKKISATSFHLKGGGWYKDGYTKGKTEAKTEVKTETKKDKKD